jgi:hypothetical protein
VDEVVHLDALAHDDAPSRPTAGDRDGVDLGG